MNLDFEKPLVTPITFFVSGVPAPGGSKRAFAIKKGGVYTGRTVVFDDAGQCNKDWRSSVVAFARDVAPAELLRGPLMVCFEFTMPRLKSHYRTTKKTGTSLREDAPRYHTTKPDITKLIRSTEDALTGVTWADDAQICAQTGSKQYGDKPGCTVTITPL